jgi:4-alpha-glucanotransferase
MTWNTLLFDTVRIDHFRGFEAYWSVPNGSADATKGRWVKAPGRQFLRKLRAQLGMGCFVAEDLGYITPEVEYLRDKFGLPGMRVLQFAFDGKQDNIHLPHNHIPNCVAYTGTHDNDTIVGWHRHLKAGKKKMVKSYIRSDGSDIAWDMIRTAWASPAKTAITTMQDLLELDSEARTNFPGKPGPNWTWRLTETKHLHKIGRRLVELSTLYGR